MTIRTINWPEERQAILEHIRLVHGPTDSDLLGQWYGSMPYFDPQDCFVIDGQNGEIAAHAMLIPRALQFGESVLRASEVGIVGTLDTYRGQGYARALMDRLLERMAERDDALGIVFGLPNFYEKWGFEYAVGLYLTSYESNIETELAVKAGRWDFSHSHQRRMASWLGVTGKQVTVRPFSLDDLPAVSSLYRNAASRGYSIMARDELMWRWQLDYMADIGRYEPDSFLVAEYDGWVMGYVRLVTSAPVNWFREDATRFSIIEAAGDDPDAIEALLAQAGSMARDYGAERIGLFVHPQSTMMSHALARGGTQRSFTGAGFLRLNDLGQVVDTMANTFQNRLAASPFAGSSFRLRISSENATADLAFGSPDDSHDVIELASPAVDLVRLFSGWYGLENLAPVSYNLRYDDLLKVLFPKGDPKIGIADLI